MTEIRNSKIWHQYGDWLIHRLLKMHTVADYHRLFETLHKVEFVILIPRDLNRALDGMRLRDQFRHENDIPDNLFEGKKCSVLEMLTALAIRIDDEYIGNPSEPNPGYIFFTMLRNLGLDRYPDYRYDEKEVVQILNRWIDREFDDAGHGSIFPLETPFAQQTKVEIWSQMQAYLSENF